jgi:uncharacterized protein (UPF0335 family)
MANQPGRTPARRRPRKPDELAEEEAVLDLYKTALGMS